jgi:branched-subunit amino acid ABC-type transport system permease component
VCAQRLNLPLPVGILMAMGVAAAAGWLVDFLLIRRLAGRPFDTFLATWGLSALIRAAIELAFGRGYQSVDYGLSGVSEVLGTTYPTYRLELMLFIGLGMLFLGRWYKRSPAGARIRAMVGNPTLAESVGLDTRAMASRAFMVGTMSAGLAGALLAPIVKVEPSMGLDYLLTSFFVLVVGGLGSLAGLFAGTGVIGGTQSLISAFSDQTTGYVTVLLASIGFLWLRPNGIIKLR